MPSILKQLKHPVKIENETNKAFHLSCKYWAREFCLIHQREETRISTFEFWFPKSKIEHRPDGTFWAPEWLLLAKAKELKEQWDFIEVILLTEDMEVTSGT